MGESAEGARRISGREGVGGCLGSWTSPGEIKIDIVSRENKILTHVLNEKNPRTLRSCRILPFNIEENANVTKFTVSPPTHSIIRIADGTWQ